MDKNLTSSSRTEAAAASLRSRILFGAAAAIASVIGVSAGALAATDSTVTPDSVNHLQHLVDCAKVMFSDPAAHAKYCDPGHQVFVSGSTGIGAAPSCGGCG